MRSDKLPGLPAAAHRPIAELESQEAERKLAEEGQRERSAYVLGAGMESLLG